MNPVVRFGVDAPRWILVVDESEKRVWRKSFVTRFCKSCVVDGTHSFGFSRGTVAIPDDRNHAEILLEYLE